MRQIKWLVILAMFISVGSFAQKTQYDPKALKLSQEVSALVQDGQMRYEQSLTNALAKVESALKVDPSFTECNMLKATILVKLRRYSDALSSIDKLIASKKNMAMAYTMKGFLNDMLGFKVKADESYMLAIKEYENQLTKNPDNVSVLINKAALTSYIKGKAFGEKEFQVIIKKYPKDKSAGFFAEMRKTDPAEFEKLFDRKSAALNAFK